MKEIGFRELRNMLQAAADQVMRQKAYLSELDALIGDGDHGQTIARTMEVMLNALQRGPRDNLKVLLQNIGWEILGVNGGATGPLLGSLFQGMSEGMVDNDKIDSGVLSSMFRKAREKVLEVSGASVGDKTMVDVLVPAVEAIEKFSGESDVRILLDAAASAAESGAESTIDMRAKKGRARNMAERSLGHKDPGATSLALIFKGLSEGSRK
jgi:dihydroxyacetone kinase-like protein